LVNCRAKSNSSPFSSAITGLQVVLLLGRDPQLVALDLRLHALGALLADHLADLLGVVLADALADGRGQAVLLAGLLRLAGLQRLERDLPLDQLLLEDVEQRGAALLELALITIDSPDQAISAPVPLKS
jgi:hypothetical protein